MHGERAERIATELERARNLNPLQRAQVIDRLAPVIVELVCDLAAAVDQLEQRYGGQDERSG
jgi:ribosomal protein S19E (S16A)